MLRNIWRPVSAESHLAGFGLAITELAVSEDA